MTQLSSAQSPAPVAVVLAAGIGERLRPLTDDRPKALVDIGGETILGRCLRLLIAHGVKEIVIASGYRQDALQRAVAGLAVPVRFCPNPAYDRTQNAVSLMLCADAVAGRSFYKLDGDVLFRSEVLARLDGSSAGLGVAVDRGVTLGSEEMKVEMEGSGRIRAFGKGLDPSSAQGESIGIERVNDVVVSSLFHALAAAYGAGETHLYYEDVYGRLIGEGLEAQGVDVTGLAWAEVDTSEDLECARELVRAGNLD